MKDELLALADRCEKATGPDPALDMAISEALDVWWMPDTRVAGPWTQSIDAAMMLIPKGYTFSLYGDGCAGVAPIGHPDDLPTADCSAATPALALCAAVLRSKANEEGQSTPSQSHSGVIG